MLAIFREIDLEQYILESSKPPVYADAAKPTEDEKKAKKVWVEGDAKTRTRIELAIGDSEMIHISGATTAAEMWKQLTTVKESKGRLGIIATRRMLYRCVAEEGFNLVEHVSKLRKLQEELHLMSSVVSDEDFVTILISSLPESWDVYTSAYLGSSSKKDEMITSHELVAILLEEDRRRNERHGDPSAAALQARGGGGAKPSTNPNIECHNCRKKGHMARDCWSKGGGKEGQGPRRKGGQGGSKNRAHQANVNDDLGDIAYNVSATAVGAPGEFSKNDWLLDCGSTSHICTNRDAFIEYSPLRNATIDGYGPVPTTAAGRGTVELTFNVNGQQRKHTLRDVLHAPDGPNCLLSVSRFDVGGGRAVIQQGKCTLHNKDDVIVGMGSLKNRLYLLDAKMTTLDRNKTNLVTQKRSWDMWHKLYGHVSISAIETLKRQGMVDGLIIDETTSPSRSCESCIQAKQAHRPFPREAEHRSSTPGERIISDVWGPTKKESLGKSRYYITFTDDCTRMVTTQFMKTKDEAYSKIIDHCAAVERKYGGNMPKYLRFDNGKELVNEKLKKWASAKGIEVETSAPYSPSQNGVAERFNRTLLELARAMLIAKSLPTFLWTEAVNHATWIRNRAPTRALKGTTPFEAWHGKKPNVSYLREFGCDVWILNEGQRQKQARNRRR